MKNLQNIDFQSSRRTVVSRLGGEFDYEGFVDDISDINGDIRMAFRTMEEDLAAYKVTIPTDIGLSEEEKRNVLS